MSAEIINLRRARKAAKRSAAERDAEANRRAHGRSKAERDAEAAHRDRAERTLAAHKRERQDPDAS